MDEKKYKNVVPTKEEETKFNKELNELAKKYSFNIGIVPQFLQNKDTGAFEVSGILFLQKVVEDTEIVSDNAEVNPALKDEPTKAAE